MNICKRARQSAPLRFGLALVAALALAGAAHTQTPEPRQSRRPARTARAAPTVAEAARFMDRAEARVMDLSVKAGRALWIADNFITADTEIISADAGQAMAAAIAELVAEAKRYEGVKLPPELARKFMLLKLAIDIPTPRDPVQQTELARIGASLQGDYGKGSWCPDGNKQNCKQLPDIEKTIANSRDPQELAAAWKGWHAIGSPMRERYARLVTLSNTGAREMGYADVGAMWRERYDMTADQFSAELDRLWRQVRPLYLSLHAYARWKLAEQYGKDLVPDRGPIPAHLLGNMWAQDWSNVYPLLAPPGASSGVDLTEALREKHVDALAMVRYGEGFFTSLGFQPLPQTFWERSLFTKPRDRDVVCHASAWSIDSKDDLRLKMCIEVSGEDFSTIHHELGHNFYQRAYNQRSPLLQGSANDGFHEAIGDTIALSVTPEYLNRIGLIDTVPPASGDTGLLLQRALGKVAFLPFGLLIDQWRWKVFAGEVKPKDYNKAWWELRERYQGVAPPEPRGEEYFDPGAKYHIPGNVPYTRYFLATILQFQFHRALCREAGYTGPLHRCSIYGSKAAGEKLARMLAMGQSRPWPEALEALTGEKQMDATAIIDYFAPLKKWLDEQNAGHATGWN